MKASVAISMIVCGTLLILSPIILNFMGVKLVASLMLEMSKDVNLRGFMPKWYDTVALIIGAVMIVAGALFSMAPKEELK